MAIISFLVILNTQSTLYYIIHYEECIINHHKAGNSTQVAQKTRNEGSEC